MLYVFVADKHGAYLVLVYIAVLSRTTVERVFRKCNVRHLFKNPNADNAGAFPANLVRHETCVGQTQRSRVVYCPSRGTCKFVQAAELVGELAYICGCNDISSSSKVQTLHCPRLFILASNRMTNRLSTCVESGKSGLSSNDYSGPR